MVVRGDDASLQDMRRREVVASPKALDPEPYRPQTLNPKPSTLHAFPYTYTLSVWFYGLLSLGGHPADDPARKETLLWQPTGSFMNVGFRV